MAKSGADTLVCPVFQQSPEIVFRGDSHFCRWRMLAWCERHQVGYIVGLAKNSRVQAEAADLMEEARAAFMATGEKQRLFADVVYAALTWDKPRRVIAKAEHGDLGSNPRFVVTNLEGEAQTLYDDVCGGGAQHPARAIHLLVRVPVAGLVLPDRGTFGVRLIAKLGCCPRHAINNGGKGASAQKRRRRSVRDHQSVEMPKSNQSAPSTMPTDVLMKYPG